MPTFRRWRSLQRNPYLLALAHLRSLPAGSLRSQVEEQWLAMSSEGDAKQVAEAGNWADAYIKGGSIYNPWTLRSNGRLLKRTAESMRNALREFRASAD